MNPLYIPINPVADLVNDFTLDCSLDGGNFRLSFSWSDRSFAWHINVYAILTDAPDPVPVLEGARLSIWWPVLAGVPGTTGRPPGELWAVDTTNVGTDAAHNELGNRVQLAYYTAAELGRS